MKWNGDEMQIVYATDEQYARIMAVSICSLLESCNAPNKISIHVISDGVTEATRTKVRELVNRYHAAIEFIELPDLDSLAGVHLDFKEFSLSTFARLWLTELLPNVERVLYLDCDTLVRSPLDELWLTQLGDIESVAGVLDAVSAINKAKIGLSPDAPYINAGVMLIDLDKWRESRALDTFTEFLRTHSGRVPHNDQGVINGCLWKSVKPIHPRYNVMSYCLALSYPEIMSYKRPSAWITKDQFGELTSAPAILHATGSFFFERPWIEDSGSPMAPVWAEVKAKTPWSGEAPNKRRPRTSAVVLRSLCSSSLRQPTIATLGILQATIRERVRAF